MRGMQIFATYPDLLKKASDPGFKARQNSNHIVRYFEKVSKLYNKDAARGRWVTKTHRTQRPCCLYRFDWFPVVPIDDLLIIFLDTLSQNPPAKDSPDQVAEKLANLHLESSNGNNDTQSLQYPADILSDIGLALDGLPFIFKAPRTRKSEWFVRTARTRNAVNTLNAVANVHADDPVAQDHDQQPHPSLALNRGQAVFTSPPYPHLRALPEYAEKVDSRSVGNDLERKVASLSDSNSMDNDLKSEVTPLSYSNPRVRNEVVAFHEKEFEWLEAFLRVVKWMKEQQQAESTDERDDGVDAVNEKR